MANQSADLIRVLCVDDHPVVRQGIAAVLASDPSFEVIAEATTGEGAVEEFQRHQPDITLLDLHLPDMSGLEAIVEIRRHFADARIVVLTTEAGDAQIQRCLEAGALGYVLKGVAMAELLDILRAAHRGERRIPGAVASRVAAHIADQPLTYRETQIVRLIAEGQRNKEIASHLAISDETVKMHVKNLMAKLGASDRTHAVTIAIRRGFIVV